MLSYIKPRVYRLVWHYAKSTPQYRALQTSLEEKSAAVRRLSNLAGTQELAIGALRGQLDELRAWRKKR